MYCIIVEVMIVEEKYNGVVECVWIVCIMKKFVDYFV